MNDASQSLTSRVEPLKADAHIVLATFLNDEPTLVAADGQILIGSDQLTPHGENAILVAACDGTRLITGGDDGKIFLLSGKESALEAGNEKGRCRIVLRDR